MFNVRAQHEMCSKRVAKAQIDKLIKQGWKPKEEIENICTKVYNLASSEGRENQEQLLKDLGWKSPAEVEQIKADLKKEIAGKLKDTRDDPTDGHSTMV